MFRSLESPSYIAYGIRPSLRVMQRPSVVDSCTFLTPLKLQGQLLPIFV